MKTNRLTIAIAALCLLPFCAGHAQELRLAFPYEQGKFTLDDPISKYIPEFKELKVYRKSGKPVKPVRAMTIRDLLMKDTGFYVPVKKIDRLAVCYGPQMDGGLRVVDDPATSRYLKKPALLSGGGGLVSTGHDYLHFCQMLLNKGALDGKRLLRAESVEMMTRNQLPDGLDRGRGQGFGLGFSVRTEDGASPKGEYGWGGMASTHFWISPKDELIVVAMSQRYPYSAQLENAVKSIIYDSILK